MIFLLIYLTLGFLFLILAIESRKKEIQEQYRDMLTDGFSTWLATVIIIMGAVWFWIFLVLLFT